MIYVERTFFGNEEYCIKVNKIEIGDEICFEKAVYIGGWHGSTLFDRFETIEGKIIGVKNAWGRKAYTIKLTDKKWIKEQYRRGLFGREVILGKEAHFTEEVNVTEEVLLRNGCWRKRRESEEKATNQNSKFKSELKRVYKDKAGLLFTSDQPESLVDGEYIGTFEQA